MKCSEVLSWLLISRATAPLPASLRRHLKRCRKCRCRRRRLGRLDLQTERWLAGPDTAAAKSRCLAQLESIPLEASGPATRPRLRWRWLLSVAAALLLGFGLGVVVLGLPERTDPAVAPAPLDSRQAEEQLVARFVEHNLSLARTYETAEQLAHLSRMAGDLRTEAVRLARQGSAEELPLLHLLFERVLQRGVVGRSRWLAATQRQEELPALLRQLRQSEAEVEQAATALPPPMADFLRPLAAAAATAARMIETDADAPADSDLAMLPQISGGLGTSRALLTVLVAQSLLLAEEDDPLQRARYCNDIADQFSSAILLASGRGDTERAAQLGKHLGNIMDQGVHANLNRLPAHDNPRLAELQLVLGRASQLVSALETSLSAAPGGQATGPSNYGQLKDLEKTLKELERALREASKDPKAKPPGGGPPRGREIRGMVKSWDAASGQLVVTVRDRGKEFEASYRLAADARIRGPGPQERTLADVTVGIGVRLLLRDPATVSELRVEPKDR